MPTLIYFLQANLFLILFFGFYYFLFKKETFHAVNRFFLLFGAVFALILPFFKSPFLKELPIYPVEAEHIATDYYIVTAAIVEKPLTHQITYLEVLEYCYFVGLGLSIIILLFRISKTIFWVKNNKNQSGTAFSFLGKVFIDKALDGQQFIKKHEEIHVRQLHFADLLFFETLKTVFWFNPVVYFYKKAIAIIHEFLADEVASAIAKDKAQYAQILLSKQFRAENAVIFTQHFFNHSTLKSRIIMLSKNPSNKTAMLKYGFVAPLFFVMLLVSSFTIAKPENLEIVISKMEDKLNKAEISNYLIKTEIFKNDTLNPPIKQIEEVFSEAEQIAEFPGGVSAMYKFLAENIRYPKVAKDANVEGRVFVNFIVEKDGSIRQINIIKGIGFNCDSEVLRVIRNMPKWKPAIQNGEEIAFQHNLQFRFFLDNGKSKSLGDSVDGEVVVSSYSNDAEEYEYKPIEYITPSEKPFELRVTKSFEKAIFFINGIEILDRNLSDIDPNSIQEIKVVKSEEAMSKYGEKGINGVILIETKKK